jgi:DNA-binding response OmpR family regulator
LQSLPGVAKILLSPSGENLAPVWDLGEATKIMVKILLVEDDANLAELLIQALENQHYLTELALDGQSGWELAEAFDYDLILLDLVLPKLDGITFCRNLRAKKDFTPVLLLTAEDTSTNKVMGLDAGADDFVVKPFDLLELLARVRALLRRRTPTSPMMNWGALQLDPRSCQVHYDGTLLHLTRKEYSLLELFLRNSRRIFSQRALIDHLWSLEEVPTENAVRVHIKGLRQKLKKAGSEDLIETVYGLGYRLKVREQDAGTKHQAAEALGQTQEQVSAMLTSLWQRHQQNYLDRLQVLERAVMALQANELSEDLRRLAQQEAHTLLGSLGSFGLSEASHLAWQIDQMLMQERSLSPFSQVELEHLAGLVLALRQRLEQNSRVDSIATFAPTLKPDGAIGYVTLVMVDDDVALAKQLSDMAIAEGIRVEVVLNLAEARTAIAQLHPDAILLSLNFTYSAEDGIELLAELATTQPAIPVVVLTDQESFVDRVKVARLGGRSFLQKSLPPEQILKAIKQVLLSPAQTEAKLLIVDDDPQMLDLLYHLLQPWGFDLTSLADPQQFWAILEQTQPDLLILDVEFGSRSRNSRSQIATMLELDGIDLCQVVRSDARWGELPVLFLSAHKDTETIRRVFVAGADDYVSKPIVGAELIARVLNRLERLRRRYGRSSVHSAGDRF